MDLTSKLVDGWLGDQREKRTGKVVCQACGDEIEGEPVLVRPKLRTLIPDWRFCSTDCRDDYIKEKGE